jgi:hypothetical protein
MAACGHEAQVALDVTTISVQKVHGAVAENTSEISEIKDTLAVMRQQNVEILRLLTNGVGHPHRAATCHSQCVVVILTAL